MKNMTITAKILTICAIVFALGLVMTIGGCAAGGAKGFKEVANGTDPADIEIMQGDCDFSSIEAKGYADYVIVGPKYYDYALDDEDLLGKDVEAKAGRVVVIYDKTKETPKVTDEGGHLSYETKQASSYGVSFSEPYSATVIVFCGDDELDSIKIESDACDAEVRGVSFKTASIDADAGDIDMFDVKSGGIKIVGDAGDVELSGVLKGTTDIDCDAGDIDIETYDALSAYSMDISVDSGDLKVGDEEIDGGSYKKDGGSDLLKIYCDSGDIEVSRL